MNKRAVVVVTGLGLSVGCGFGEQIYENPPPPPRPQMDTAHEFEPPPEPLPEDQQAPPSAAEGGVEIGDIGTIDDITAISKNPPAPMPEPEPQSVYGQVVTETSSSLTAGDPESVTRVVRKYQGQLKYCYEKELRSDPALAGGLTLRLELLEGRVSSATAEGDLGQVDECAAAKAERWRFPADLSGQVTIKADFSPKE